MDSKSRTSKSILDWFSLIEKNPYPFSFHKINRVLEAANLNKPRIGKAVSIKDEYVRLKQPPFLHHPASQISSASSSKSEDAPFELSTYLFGLLGPNGPMPRHITLYIRQRQLVKDKSSIAFFDLFNHRFLSHYYRAWSDTEPVTQLDRSKDNAINSIIAGITGIESSTSSDKTLPKELEYYYAGHFSRNEMTCESLTKVLSSYFHSKFVVERFKPKWVDIPKQERFILNHCSLKNKQLGKNTLIGKKIITAQHELMIHVYPSSFEEYESYLSVKTQWLESLIQLMKRCIGMSFTWQLRFCLPINMIPEKKLGANTVLNKSNWLTINKKNSVPKKTKKEEIKMVYQTISPIKYLQQKNRFLSLERKLIN